MGRRGEPEERYWRDRIRINNKSKRRKKQTTTKYADEECRMSRENVEGVWEWG